MNVFNYVAEKYRLAAKIAVGALAILLISWVAGQCRTWSKPKPTKVTIDAGTPVAGPTSQSPTVAESVPIARPDLTMDELEAAAKKYGLTLRTVKQPEPQAESAQGGISEETIMPVPEIERTWPMLLAEETFVHHPSGAAADVSAWLPGYGQRVDLRASWRSWVPPAVAQPKGGPSYCMTPERFFGNEAKWYGGLGAGVVANSKGAGLGPTADLGYLGPRTGKVTWGAGSHAAFSQQSGLQGDAAFRLSW